MTEFKYYEDAQFEKVKPSWRCELWMLYNKTNTNQNTIHIRQ